MSNRRDGDGELCWCYTGRANGLFMPEHMGYCLKAREALNGATGAVPDAVVRANQALFARE